MGRVRTAAVGGLVEDDPLAAAATTLTSAGLSYLPLFGAGDFGLIIFDPDGKTGEPFAKRMTAHALNAVTGTIDAAAVYGTARDIRQGMKWRLTDILDQDGNGAGIIGRTEYGPGSNATVSLSSTTLTAVDSTNLKTTFTVPPSGIVDVELYGVVTSATDDAHFGLLEGAATVGTTKMIGRPPNRQMCNATIQVTGLTPGAAKTYLFAWACASASAMTFSYGPGGINVFPNASMIVRAVNV